MDFFEKLFGFSPDGGDGSAEFLFLAVVAAALVGAGILLRRFMRNRSAGRSRK